MSRATIWPGRSRSAASSPCCSPALLWFAWQYVATLFLIFAGILLGVALNAMTELLGRLVRCRKPLRLVVVCLTLAVLFSGVLVLGGTTIAQQATVLSNTIKSQLTRVKSFLERNGVDTSYFDLGNDESTTLPADPTGAGRHAHDPQSAERQHAGVQRRRDRRPDA